MITRRVDIYEDKFGEKFCLGIRDDGAITCRFYNSLDQWGTNSKNYYWSLPEETFNHHWRKDCGNFIKTIEYQEG